MSGSRSSRPKSGGWGRGCGAASEGARRAPARRCPRIRPLAAVALAAAAAIALAGAAAAADVKVSYRVDAKALKSGTPAGTPLTFQLYSDSTCAALVKSEVVSAEGVSMIEQLKPIKIKSGPKPPGAADIGYTMAGVTPQPAFYLEVTGAGIVPIGGACQLQTASIGGTVAPEPPVPPSPPTCGPDAVKVGDLCVDKYEESLWDIPAGQTAVIQHVKDGTATLAELTGAGATQIAATQGAPTYSCSPAIPGTFPANGGYTAPLYAASIPGVAPTACLSAYQAYYACELSGKRMLTNSEWLAAATGTPDPNTDNGTSDCNTGSPGTPTGQPSSTGSRSSCVSTAGIYDAVGNVEEWTREPSYIPTTFDAFGLSTLTPPGAWIHGGAWYIGTGAGVGYAVQYDPLSQSDFIGFRCAR